MSDCVRCEREHEGGPGEWQCYRLEMQLLRAYYEMKWTKDKPTEPGWYWTRLKPESHGEIDYWNDDDLSKALPHKFNHFEWAGPIPEPEE